MPSALVLEDPMAETSWYLDASLVSDAHVFCAGTLAQCVRKWGRLSDQDRAMASIRIGSEILGVRTIGAGEIAALAGKPELARV